MPADRRRQILLGALLAAAVAAPFVPALGCGFFWDDRWYIVENQELRSWGGLARIWLELGTTLQYYPMVWTSFWVEYQLWGLDPAGYHAVNVFLQALAAVLCWRVLRQLAVPGAYFAALVFGLHPVQVESVAWITERKNVLSGVLYLGALLCWLHAEGLAEERRREGHHRGLYLLSLGLFLLALLSKTTTCSLPAAMVLLLWWKRAPLGGPALRRTAPFFALGLVLAAVTVTMEKVYVGAAGSEWALSPLQHLLLASRIVVFYATKLAWPVPLAFFYPRWEVDATSASQYLYPLAVAAALGVAWAGRGRWGRGPLVALLFFAGTLVPALGFFNVYPMRYSWVADHFQYLASPGLIALACAAGAVALARWRWLAVGTGSLIALALAGLTVRHARVFESDESVWRDTIAKTPTAWVAHNNLGNIVRGRRQLDEALSHYRAALEVKPDYADALSNMATVHGLRGEYDQAEVLLRRALAIDRTHGNARRNLALLERRRAGAAAPPAPEAADAGRPGP